MFSYFADPVKGFLDTEFFLRLSFDLISKTGRRAFNTIWYCGSAPEVRHIVCFHGANLYLFKSFMT